MYALTPTSATGGERRERHRAIGCMCSPHTSYMWRGERGDIEPITCMHSPHTATGGERREDKETIKWMHSLHTSYRWRGERERESYSQSRYALATKPLQVESRERDIEPIKWMRSPHTSYRWRGERGHRAIKCMRSPHTSYR